MVIRRIGVWSAARLYGGISAVFGLILGLILAAVSLVGAGVAGTSDQMPGLAAGLLGVGAILVLPVLYGVLGIVGGAVGAFLYNLFADIFGGLEIETG
jgi:hypothetical protein